MVINIKFIDVSNNTVNRTLESQFDIVIPDTTSSIGDLAVHFNNRFNERGNDKFIDQNPESFIGALLHAEQDQFENKLVIRRKNYVEWDLAARNNTGIYDNLQLYDDYGEKNDEKTTQYPLINFVKLNYDEKRSNRQYLELSIDFNPDNIPAKKSLAWKMGFRNDTKISTNYYPPRVLKHKPNDTYYLYMKAEATYGENIDQYYFLYIDDFVGNHNESIIVQSDENYLKQNILARIQRRNANMFEVNHDNNNDFIFKKREYFGPVNIKKLRLKLIDKFGEEKRSWISENLNLDGFQNLIFPPHTGIYIKKKIFEIIGPYDETYKISSDQEFMYKLFYLNNFNIKFCDLFTIKMKLGGLSTKSLKNIIIANYETLKILNKYNKNVFKNLLIIMKKLAYKLRQ